MNNENNLNPINIEYLQDLSNDSNNQFSVFYLDNKFCVFKAINNIIYLIYSSNKFSIISYDLVNNKKINEIKKAHYYTVKGIRYIYDKFQKRDLIISISDDIIKLWNINNFECILEIKRNDKNEFYNSACFLTNINQIFIIAGNRKPIQVFDLNGNIQKEINKTDNFIFFIDAYYDEKLSKNFIITGNDGYSKSYDFINNKLYYKYSMNNKDYKNHNSISILNDKEITQLIDSSADGNIRIWNFHTGQLLKKIDVSQKELYGICLWNNDYLFVGCKDNSIKLIELKNGNIVKNLSGHNSEVITIKKIIHPKYGECIISQGRGKDHLKLWINKNTINSKKY